MTMDLMVYANSVLCQHGLMAYGSIGLWLDVLDPHGIVVLWPLSCALRPRPYGLVTQV